MMGLPPTPPPMPMPMPPAALPTPPRRPKTRGPGLLVALIAGGLVLLAAGGGFSAYLLTRGDSHEKGRAGSLNVREASFEHGRSLLSEPGEEWIFDPDDVIPGGEIDGVFGDWYGPHLDIVAFDDILVTRVRDNTDEDADIAPSVLVGLDAADGSVAWTVDDPDVGGSCWGLKSSYLLCSDAELNGLRALDPDSGKVRASSDFAPGYGDPVIDGGNLYAMGAPAGGEYGLSALDPTTLTPRWHTPFSPTPIEEAGDPSRYAIRVAGQEVRVKDSDWAVGAFDRASGTLLRPATEHSYYSPIGLDPGWTLSTDGEVPADNRTTLAREGGRIFLTASGDPWLATDSDDSPIQDNSIGIGNSLYDLTTGEPVWQRNDLDSHGWTWTPDQQQILAGSVSGDDVLVLDAATGETQWSYQPSGVNDDLHGVDQAWFHGDAALVTHAENDELTVYDRTDGEFRWSRDLARLDTENNEEAYGYWDAQVTLSPRTVAIASPGGVLGLTDFPAKGEASESDDDRDSDDVAYTTACGRPPEFVPVETEVSGGGITVTYEVRAVCPGGQWLNLSQLRVPVVVDDYTYADGYFDFSDTPYWIPDYDGGDYGGEGEPRELRLTYDFADTTVPYDDIAGAIEADAGTGNVVVIPCEPGPDNNDDAPVPSDPSYGADPADAVTSSGGPATDDAQTQESALEALQRIAAEDKDAVAQLDWTAQLSSKRPGTRDDGIVYDSYDAILALHLEYRSRYPESLLAWSNDWPGSFGPSSQDYWVTLGGQSESTTVPILDWCRAEGWGDGDCWAKRLLTSGNPDKESRHKDSWPPDPSKN